MTNIALQVTKAMSATNDATDWVEIAPGDGLAISIPSGITGTVNIQRSFDGSTSEGILIADDGTSNFAPGAQLNYRAAAREYIRVIAALVTAGSATAKIRRN